MGRLTLLILLVAPSFLHSQDYIGTWTGQFTRDNKTAAMKLELVDDGREVVGLFTIYSTDATVPDKIYSVKRDERAGNKFILRKYRKISPDDKYENKMSGQGYQKAQKSSLPTNGNVAAGYSAHYYGKATPNLSYMSTVSFYQFIARYNSNQSIETIDGNWYVSWEGLNSYARPAGGFSVEKKQSTISEEAKLLINEIFNL